MHARAVSFSKVKLEISQELHFLVIDTSIIFIDDRFANQRNNISSTKEVDLNDWKVE